MLELRVAFDVFLYRRKISSLLQSYNKALEIIKTHYPDHDSAVFLLDFNRTLTALLTQFPMW